VTASVAPGRAFAVWLQHLLIGCAVFTPLAFLGSCAVGSLVRADHVGWAYAVAAPSIVWCVAWLFWLLDAWRWRPSSDGLTGWTWMDGWTDTLCSLIGCCSFIPTLRSWGYLHVCNPWCLWISDRQERTS
jgi:hypothetical protein